MKRASVFVGLMLLALSTAAQGSDAIANWAAPSTWTPPSTQAAGRSALVALYPPLPFIPLSPCRVADIRAGSGFPAGYGPPAIASGGTRNFSITGVCGIPAGAQAVSFNFTVWAPTTRGDLRVYPGGVVPVPVVSTMNWEAGILALANAAVVPLGTGGSITVQNDGATPLEIFVDVNGYYTNIVGASTFDIASTSAYGILSASTTGIGVEGVGPVSGVVGNNSGGAVGFGVFGQGGIGIGVAGQSTSNIGVEGFSTSSAGVQGVSASTATGKAGVLGRDGSAANPGNFFSAGVRGEGRDGVVGISNTAAGIGVAGVALSPATVGVLAFGELQATGAKAFIEPHPADPALTIRYVALEGPEAGTYFRGTSRTRNGAAVIPVPESFRMVTDDAGLTVQVTATGRTRIWVETEDLNEIVVRSDQDVRFHYHVNGVRRAFRNWQVVAEGHEFQPVAPDQKMPGWLTEEAKSRLIANGTYNPDGTVNMNTAERMGWAKIWREEAAAAAAKVQRDEP